MDQETKRMIIDMCVALSAAVGIVTIAGIWVLFLLAIFGDL